MSSKTCTHCKLEKSLADFSNDRKYKSSYCMSCANERSKKYRRRKKEENELGFYVVYYLPNEHRVGITKNLWERMRKLKYTNKLNTNDVKILQTTDTKEDAEILERMWAGTLAINGLY